MKEITEEAILRYALDCVLIAAKRQGCDLSALRAKAHVVALDSGDKDGPALTSTDFKTKIATRISEAVDRVTPA